MKIKHSIKVFIQALNRLGLFAYLVFGLTLCLIVVLESTNPIKNNGAKILTTVSYSILASIIVYFATYLIPQTHNQLKLKQYLMLKSYRIHTIISGILLDLCVLSNDSEPNRRERSQNEWESVCSKADPYQKISGWTLQRTDFDDFFAYYHFACQRIKQGCTDLMVFSEGLTIKQVQLIMSIEFSVSSPTANGRRTSSIKGLNSIPDFYGKIVHQLFNDSKNLTKSFGDASHLIW